jgi:hypothetical protein
MNKKKPTNRPKGFCSKMLVYFLRADGKDSGGQFITYTHTKDRSRVFVESGPNELGHDTAHRIVDHVLRQREQLRIERIGLKRPIVQETISPHSVLFEAEKINFLI